MTDFLIGAYGADMGGTALGVARGRSTPDGRFEYLGLLAEAESPSWLARDGRSIHAALEGASSIASFALEEGGALRPLGVVASGRDASPCHLAVVARPDGIRSLAVARYRDGVIAVHGLGEAAGPVVQELAGEGSGPLPAQASPHAHHVLPLADGRVLTSDLGADRVLLHRWDGAVLERTASIALPPGTGPRDLLALPDGRIAVLGEWSCEVAFLRPADSGFELETTVPLPGADGENQAAALALSGDGRLLVAGIRGADRVALLRLDAVGAIPVADADCGGHWPRHLVVDGGFVHVANQLSNSVASFRLGPEGSLEPLGEPVPVPSPTCLLPLD